MLDFILKFKIMTKWFEFILKLFTFINYITHFYIKKISMRMLPPSYGRAYS